MPETLTLPKPVSAAEFYRFIRERIDYEETLLNQRVIWLIFSQSFLVSAYAIILNSPPEPKSPMYSDLQSCLIWLLPVLSLILSIIIYVSVISALSHIAQLRESYETYPKDDTIDRFPMMNETSFIRRLGGLPPILVPLLFIGAWAFLLIKELA
ncbi:MAG TPA: hypothetical protein DD379_03940 [Cyanobacteria bacterium UBA11162]|nr:hypothetical protein [Cyanobacteria bacterium UBA11162]